MRHALLTVLSLLLCTLVPAAALAQHHIYVGWQKGPWEHFSTDDGIQVYTNDEPPKGTDVDAVRVDTVLNGPIEPLFKMVIDHERAAKFSFVREYKVIHQTDSEAYVYQRVKESGLVDRDFTIHIQLIRPTAQNGNSWGFSWKQANHKGPAERNGVVRATMVQGSYVLTPLPDGRTKLSYRLIFDPNTWIPDFVLRRAVRNAAVETVKTLRRDAKAAGLLR
jgi:hypothetical protein